MFELILQICLMDMDNSQQQTISSKDLIKKFSTLDPLDASIQFTLAKSKEENKYFSCDTTVQFLIEGLRLRGQKIPKDLIQITNEQHQKLTGGIHPQIQQKLKKSNYFAIAIRAFHFNKARHLSIKPKNMLISGQQKKHLFFDKANVHGDHVVLFHKRNTEKDIYFVYQSWQDQFSFQQWLSKSDQFQSISTQLYEEKIYPYEDPKQYLSQYFRRIKDLKMAQKNCPRCGQVTIDGRVKECLCLNHYQFQHDQQYLEAQIAAKQNEIDMGLVTNFDIEQYRKKLEIYRNYVMSLTKSQFSWVYRMSAFNSLMSYVASQDN